MNIVIIRGKPVDPLRPSEQTLHSFMRVYQPLADAGKALWPHAGGTFAGFLVSTPNLLIALRQAEMVPADMSIQVFSLASPEAQLLGIANESNQGDPESYRLANDFPKP